ncbi:S-adenosyl-L-methionine-dependent methyltransferase [Mycena polygramma]|nr:S-adenosyl-L-methionine-dependent methyltransferase [Mycena polygramma]
MESISTLRRLASIIMDSVTTMEDVYERTGMPLPSLDEPFNPQDPAEALRQDPEVSNAVKNIVAAAAQISATFHLSSYLLAASDFNIVEILREAGPDGANAKEIAAPSGVDPGVPARILRLLATHHIFREVSPGVFANNRVSSTLDKGKSSSALRAERLTGSSGIAALVENSADIVGKSAVCLSDSLLNPGKLPFNIAFRTDEAMFAWYQRPENTYNVRRFAVAMRGTAATESQDLIFQGFDWSALPSNGTIVDVGGGIGHLSLTIAQKYTHLRIANQDLAAPIELSKAVNLITILSHLRGAAAPTTRLVIIEKIVPFASAEDTTKSHTQEIPGAAPPVAQSPLLPNWGVATADLYLYDLTVSAFNFPVMR